MIRNDYVHGYTVSENERLFDQASTLTDLLHSDTFYPEGHSVLEAGCGVGAQTVTLAKNSPEAQITSIDISETSILSARELVYSKGLSNVTVQQADVFDLPFGKKAFDHVFVCFVLEHLHNPIEALVLLGEVLKPGGTITVIEGDHGSAYFHPDSPYAQMAIQCLIDLQREAAGNALIGRELYPLLVDAGYRDVSVSPRMVYADSSRPEMVEGFTKKTFTAMVAGVQDQALQRGMIDMEMWERGISDLYRTSEADGTFCYTFFKALARK